MMLLDLEDTFLRGNEAVFKGTRCVGRMSNTHWCKMLSLHLLGCDRANNRRSDLSFTKRDLSGIKRGAPASASQRICLEPNRDRFACTS
ncbi:hypothetical protein [Planctomycetes bacterium CA13]|uniref:hypothetical protein n=1 Tax=Novipirellula herctigrandis TaxID=2527986 RepID=UPI0011B7AC36